MLSTAEKLQQHTDQCLSLLNEHAKQLREMTAEKIQASQNGEQITSTSNLINPWSKNLIISLKDLMNKQST